MRHQVAIVVGGQQVVGWTSYSIETSLLSPTDSFELVRAVDREAYNLCATDTPVQVTIDGVPVVTGRIDHLSSSAREGRMTVRGRCKAGRLVDESAPGVQYGGLRMLALLERLADPWFKVASSGARDRDVRRGKGHKAPAATEPLVIDAVTAGGRIEPGQPRWTVIEQLVSQAGYLCWSSADGRELVVGPPNYQQEVQWRFEHREGAGNVLDLTSEEDITEGYSQILVVGSGRGTDADYGVGPADRAGKVLDGPGPFGVGLDFLAPKRLVIAQQADSTAEAQRLAKREAIRRNQRRRTVTVEAPGFGQLVRGTTPTIFAPNTLARVIYDKTGLDAVYLVVSCRYQSRRDGDQTTLSLVPRGTELSL